MDFGIKKEILNEYRIKREYAEKIAKEKKERIINSIPQIESLQEKINELSIELLKSSLIIDKIAKDVKTENLKFKIRELDFKIDSLLEKNGYSKDMLEIRYDCSKCNDTGYFDGTECSCFKQEQLNRMYKQSNMNKLEEENFQTFNLGLYSNEVSEQYGSKKSPQKNISDIKKVAENFCNNIEKKEQKNLLFIGNTGLGKTFLSNAIAYETIKNGYTAIYQTSSVLMDFILKYKFSYNKDENLIEEYNKIFESDLLIIDDLGTETINNMKFTELFNIINTRLLNNKKIVISTNLSLEKLYDLYDERIVSRLIGDFTICRFFGEDIRLKKKKMN